MRILGFGTYDAARHPRIGIILDGLARHGDEVLESNAPLGFTTAERVAMLERPWRVGRLVARIVRRWATIARRARRVSPVDAVIVGYLGLFDIVLARLLFLRQTVVLDHLVFAADTARDRRVAGGLRTAVLSALDALAVACADVVVVDSAPDAELLSAAQRHKAVVVPVGASERWFAAAAERAPADPGRPLRVIFFGLFTPLHGATVIGDALADLAARPDIEATLVGTGQDFADAKLRAAVNSHVTWLDWVEPDDLPALVVKHDVCLGIFGTGPKARRVVPNKVYQGAAAGCAIVTSDTETQRGAFGGAAVFVPAGEPLALAQVLAGLAHDRERVAALGTAAYRKSVECYTATKVVEPLRSRLAVHVIAPMPADAADG